MRESEPVSIGVILEVRHKTHLTTKQEGFTAETTDGYYSEH